MRSHRTLIPFIALALALAANAAPVLHPLGSHDSHTDLLHLKRTSLPQDLFETRQFSTEVGSGDEDEQLSRRDIERRAKKKKKNNRKKKKQQQAAKATAESTSDRQTSDVEHVAVPEGNQKEAMKPPQPANKTEGSAPTHAEPSNSGSTNTEEKGNAKEEKAESVASHNDPKPGLSRVSTSSSSISSTSSHSSTFSCSSQGSAGSNEPYSHDVMYGSNCEPVPHKPAVEDSGKQNKEKTDEDKEKEKKKGKKKMRNTVALASSLAAAGLVAGGTYGIVKLAGSSESAFKSVGSTDETEGSSDSSFDNVQFPGVRPLLLTILMILLTSKICADLGRGMSTHKFAC
ncbi:hypothetical protein F5050DRAFT_166147 [Lentinula boryana]|uniref:Uncharacterized protein n=1 Tax=Lentinula boryana TaxID=40481 RepID=A0ABQ8QCK3_9AGAR|nr:hypothetical protein F5050DRAFT_166147 [Lentinula boryana]